MAEIVNVRRTAVAREIAVVETTPDAPGRTPFVDIVCGMEVDPDTPLRVTHEGRLYLFCSEGCRSRFIESPEAFIR